MFSNDEVPIVVCYGRREQILIRKERVKGTTFCARKLNSPQEKSRKSSLLTTPLICLIGFENMH